MRNVAFFLVVAIPVFSGCFANEAEAPVDPEPSDAVPEVTLRDGQVHMEIPVPVFLIGFPTDLAADLRNTLTPLTLSGGGALVPTARFEVHVPDEAWQTEFDAFLKTATHVGHSDLTGFSGLVLDGRLIEDHLATSLPRVHEVPEGITALVVVDPRLRGHAYHYDGNVGWREPVRTFGERQSLLVWDPIAEPDPWVGTAEPHHIPVATATADHIAAWVERATAIRALHMPIWPPTTLFCHAVTIILAVRNTSVTPAVLGLQSWHETLDIERLQTSFENLTQDPVYVDLVVLQLPADDPPLEFATRENNARAVTQTYLDLNFDAYHLPHEGCEPYLSLIVFGDLADQRTSSNGNAVMMTASGHRISTSLIAENVRVMTEAVGYNDVWDDSTDFERVGPGANPLEWFNWVAAHETGHLFSLPHPNYSTGDVAHSDPAFASTWNVMGYQMRRIVTETSHVDNHNIARNQAAYALVEAQERGVDELAMQQALQAMAEYRWKDATEIATGL